MLNMLTLSKYHYKEKSYDEHNFNVMDTKYHLSETVGFPDIQRVKKSRICCLVKYWE